VGAEKLREYWTTGAGAAKIKWGAPGDFDRCVAELGKYIDDAKGYCNLAHHAALGIWPAQHAAELKGRSGMATDTKKPEDAAGDGSPGDGRAESLAPYFRSFPLEDISIRSGGDGRTGFPVNAPQLARDGRRHDVTMLHARHAFLVHGHDQRPALDRAELDGHRARPETDDDEGDQHHAADQRQPPAPGREAGLRVGCGGRNVLH
jgi:hypothetical protein